MGAEVAGRMSRRLRRPGTVAAFFVCLTFAVVPALAHAAERYVLIVSGAAGNPELASQHASWRVELVTALRDKLQMPADRIIVLVDKTIPVAPSPSAERVIQIDRNSGVPIGGPGAPGRGTPVGRDGAPPTQPDQEVAAAEKSDAARQAQVGAELDASALPATRDNVRAVFTRLARELHREDVLMVVLFGHSTFDGVDAKFNLVGPDLEATEWERLVASIPARVVFVNTTAASAPFMKRLAGQGRVVITATDNPAQKYQTVFPEFFAQAFDAKDVDLDKDGRVSIWEAFAYASTQVKTWYRQRGQLSVERPVLDDTGDGIGKESGETGPDGSIASRTFLDASDDPGAGTGPALSELINRRNVLEGEFEDLKKRRGFMPPGDYEKQRDQLLIDIARISHEIRAEQRRRS
jgi:hypothetical protein